MAVSAEHLATIKTLPSLIKYLRDELDWPIEADNFEDLTLRKIGERNLSLCNLSTTSPSLQFNRVIKLHLKNYEI